MQYGCAARAGRQWWPKSREVTVVRVFTAPDGTGGNLLGVLLGTADIADEDCQAIAAELAYSETVFVDDVPTGRCRIFTPGVQLPFAGHPMVGLAWVLERQGGTPAELRPPAGTVACWRDDDDWWVRAQAAWCPDWQLLEQPSPAAVDDVEPPDTDVHEYRWAWADRARGEVRARAFASEVGIVEDEATGSAAIRLATLLQARVTIHQGRGSRLLATPFGAAEAGVGGTVAFEETRTI